MWIRAGKAAQDFFLVMKSVSEKQKEWSNMSRIKRRERRGWDVS